MSAVFVGLVVFATLITVVGLSAAVISISNKTSRYDQAWVSADAGVSTFLFPLTPGVYHPLELEPAQIATAVFLSGTSSPAKFGLGGTTGVSVTTISYTPNFAAAPTRTTLITGTFSGTFTLSVAAVASVEVLCFAGYYTNPATSSFTFNPLTSVRHLLDTSSGSGTFTFTLPFSRTFDVSMMAGDAMVGLVPTIMVPTQVGCTFQTRGVTVVVNENPFVINTA